MEPITTELRKLMAHTVDGFDLRRPLVECDRTEFERLCDQIDAVHESLERENDRLKVELDRVLGELDDMHKTDGISNKTTTFMHSGMSITHELREYATNDSLHYVSDYLAIADRIDAEHKRAIAGVMNDALYHANEKDMAGLGWVRLPKDADGEHIHIGDVMEGEKVGGGFCEPFEVVGYIMSNGELEPMDEHKCPRNRRYLHHHHTTTVEDVLREFAEKMNENMGMYTGEAIDADEWRDADAKTVAKFAKRLTLAEGENE